jgi:amino acid permease
LPVILDNFGLIDLVFWRDAWSRPLMLLIVASVIFPIALVKNLHGLRYFSLVGILSIFYIVIVIVIQTFSYAPIYFSYEKLIFFRWDTVTVIKAFSVAIFSYVGHQNVFPLRIELTRPYEHRMKKVFL